MKIVLAMVMSLDGKTTKWGDPQLHDWTSKEDQAHFNALIKQNTVIVMGRQTYEVAAPYMEHIPSRLRIVMTKSPEKFTSLEKSGMLEFTNETAQEIIDRLRNKKVEEVLLVGGEQINTLFFQAKLVDEIILTIEPHMFGKGNGLVIDEKLDIQLQLQSSEQLNEKGTLLLKYKVI